MRKWLCLSLAVMLVGAATAIADGCFVGPKFVWDKHKDIDEPTQKAILIYDAGREDLILQVKYGGPVNEFGWLIPVPNQPSVQLGSMKCFYELSRYTQEHFESERPRSQDDHLNSSIASAAKSEEPPVKVVEIKTVGAYQIAVLSTRDAAALSGWLQTNQFYFPKDKLDVIDAYVRQQWYFVAVKINLGHGIFHASAAGDQLATGELNPLYIRFASDRCVFPLKISAVNGQPSEVQVYVLSLEPLLEKAMLEKRLPLIHSNDLARAASRAKGYKAQMMNHRRQMAGLGKLIVIPEDEIDKKAESIAKSPQLDWDEGLNYAKVGQIDLPNSAKLIPRLAGKSWWLTKQTWTFSPSEMNDLIFQPAIPVLSGMLGTAYGYIGIEYLATFQSDAVPALVAALQSPDPSIRLLAARHLDSFRDSNRNPVHDPRLNSAGAVLLKDPDPVARAAAVHMLFESWDPQCTASLVEAMADEDPEVRGSASGVLAAHQSEVKGYLPRVKALLKDKNPNVRAVAFELLHRMRVPVAAEDLLGVFPASDAFGLVWDAFNDYTELTGKDVPDSQALPLLQNTNPSLRCLGLSILYHNADKQAVEMALPLLIDREPEVRSRAAALLRGLTGQHFTETQAGEWEKWWVANKANFAIQLHPEELRPHPPPWRMQESP